MQKYTRCREERETSIAFDESSRTATVYSCSPTILNKLKKLKEKYPDSVECVWVEPTERITPQAMKFTLPVSYVKFSGPRRLTDKQLAALNAGQRQNRF